MEPGHKLRWFQRWESTKTAQGWLRTACWAERDHCGSVGKETAWDIFKGEDSFCFFQEMLSIVTRLLPKEFMDNCRSVYHCQK